MLKVTIEGRPNTGKSSTALLISQLLNEIGVRTEVVDSDNCRKLLLDTDRLRDRLRGSTVVIETKQAARTT